MQTLKNTSKFANFQMNNVKLIRLGFTAVLIFAFNQISALAAAQQAAT